VATDNQTKSQKCNTVNGP